MSNPILWRSRRESNPPSRLDRPRPSQTATRAFIIMAGVAGTDPALAVLETAVQPLTLYS